MLYNLPIMSRMLTHLPSLWDIVFAHNVQWHMELQCVNPLQLLSCLVRGNSTVPVHETEPGLPACVESVLTIRPCCPTI